MDSLEKVTRVEVINHRKDGTGREYVNWHKDNAVTYQLQDSGRTLKIFIVDTGKLMEMLVPKEK